MSYSTLVVEREDDIGWLIFDRPEVGNAIDATMFRELEAAWLELDADEGVRVIVNTGNGKAFQTGLDVLQLSRDREALKEQSRRTRDATLRLSVWQNGISTPVIAAVNGVCAGGGLHFVADADIVIASTKASFLDPHVSIGQVSAYETIALLNKIPAEAVMRMALMGSQERMSADRALALGLVSQIVEPDELRPTARALAQQIAKNSPAAMAATKRALWGAFETGLTDASKAGGAELVGMWGHPDQEEGPRAFAERRTPQWADRAGGDAEKPSTGN